MNVPIHVLKSEGIELNAYPIDESQMVANAADVEEIEWNNRFFRVTRWNERAEEHREGQTVVEEISRDDIL